MARPDSPAVLWVDDELDRGSPGIQLLTVFGLAVDVARTGAEAVGLAKLRRYSAVFLDLRLPDMGGLDLLGRLREEADLRAPVAVLTGFATVPSVVQAMRLGVVDYLEKPLMGDALLTVARRLVSAPAYDSTAHLDVVQRLVLSSGTPVIPGVLARSLIENVDGWLLTFLTVTRLGNALFAGRQALLQILCEGLTSAEGFPPLTKEVIAALERDGEHAIAEVRIRHDLSERVFRRELARSLGCTWSQLTSRLRVRQCLRRLTIEDEHIRQIAFGAGYAHPWA